ncbi:enoyl-CoA hydratase [Bacillus toyonensis]|uniref:enoyl-CoA hydratase n=1 Tax=Bacillus toyonensis TaxID=155322 RepID=UPI000BF009B1|nr:enoyl-CoA hydratase [Bacillus toyonensis]PGA04427.1 enoyl-CoA hydratase [Bacillus toyonensis]PGA52573.1 enoyl-CoA hydratase [Bacillus toyonensis]PGB39739.1 enoyl-CoA hydratase [Bacillus toyonensis]PGE34994.1 enoyl-CoA hydratase [Bacillus toyonensis]
MGKIKKFAGMVLAGAIGLSGLNLFGTTNASAAEYESSLNSKQFINISSPQLQINNLQENINARTSAKIVGKNVQLEIYNLENPFNTQFYKKVLWSFDADHPFGSEESPSYFHYVNTKSSSSKLNYTKASLPLWKYPEIKEDVTIYGYVQAKNGLYYPAGSTQVTK